jgi:hypothetical protein
VNDPRTLRRLHTELRDLAAELTQELQRPLIRDDQTTEHAAVPALLTQLRDEVAPDSSRGRGGGRGTPAPISVEAGDMLAQIETDAVALHLEALAQEHTVETRITALAAIGARWPDQHKVEVLVTHLRKWRDEIKGLLDPPQRLTINAACPACGVKMVRRWDATAHEHVQVPALAYDPARGAVCQNTACGHVWPHANLEHLAQVLGCEPVGEDDGRG